jgi:3-isopropylmalate/(R)-2-methylmalate dehydratase small subunit
MFKKQTQLIQGKCWVFGDDINTDLIIPTKYLQQFLPPEALSSHAMEVLDPEFANNVNPGNILIAGHNFACGSMREEAAIALKALKLSAIVAESFARIFYRNAIHNGLVALECKGISQLVQTGSQIEIDLENGFITNLYSKEKLSFHPLPKVLMDILNAGGLIPLYQKKGGKNAPS